MKYFNFLDCQLISENYLSSKFAEFVSRYDGCAKWGKPGGEWWGELSDKDFLKNLIRSKSNANFDKVTLKILKKINSVKNKI